MSKDQLSQQLLIVAKTAAFRAGEMLIEAFAGNKPTSEKSSRHDLVTEYDHQAERIIIDQIMGQYPDSTILGEEGGSQGSGAVQWFVDPIDGTTNFALGIPFF
ncbi:MAG TPA: inositol monophosphatase family protein, partial [Anaerolineae bacterium]|nr:inositol monophosphatase family protein [Anaerolineae bacterium]